MKKTRKGGMIRNLAKPIGRSARVIGEEFGKDYLQKKMPKIVQNSLDDPSLIKHPEHLLLGRRKMKTPSIKINQEYFDEKENANPNLRRQGGKTNRRNNKKRQSRKIRRAFYK